MSVCQFRGCVSEATWGDKCPVHISPEGARQCQTCVGSGELQYLDPEDHTKPLRRGPCVTCGGIGFADAKRGRGRLDKPEPVDQRGLIVEAEREP
jgi:DnaJ-class molecular chaperone